MKGNTKREGFTLVELLIVIVVIGVLSAMMMLSSTEAVSSAKAADIVSNLRNLKTAALAFYADHLDDVSKGTGVFASNGTLASENARKEIWKYMNNNTVDTNYTFGGGATGKWFVWYHVTDSKVAEKLYSRKDSVGLWKASGSGANEVTSTDATAASQFNNSYVGMFIR
ncbi:MAG: type II secretion system protein [Synergistales bacterium]|nr:type II secretion system protein [Synergistales bacterium]MDY6402076.1 type II secretion system protein [Synergistales bacterium]MDY6405263.1 type II secretion system protein [Synergistales bacterium]MDY6410797.1 type II secretion system protein [Synergistales bacterium]MDY6413852.1 type II secretion system protein [Synergistales bacterium]